MADKVKEPELQIVEEDPKEEDKLEKLKEIITRTQILEQKTDQMCRKKKKVSVG